MLEDYGWWMPPDISAHGHGIDLLLDVLHWFMGVLFVGWGAFFLYCLFRFRGGGGRTANSVLPKGKISKYAEVGIVIFEVVLLVGMSIPVWNKAKNEMPAGSENALRARIVGEQFAWNVHYPGDDGVFGKTSPDLMNASNLVGLDKSDPAAADDFVAVSQLHIPVDTPVLLELTSKDVIHSFWIPVLRVKQDVIPGMSFQMWFTAKKTGKYQMACAQLCGNNHYKMFGDVIVETQEEFDEWIAWMTEDDGEEEEEDE
jgi:cytochrome c oxidase subunit 2